MILQLDSQQTIALFELVVTATTTSLRAEFDYNPALEEIKEKLRSMMVESFDNMHALSSDSIFPSWVKNEQNRIDELTRKLEVIKVSFQQDNRLDDLYSMPQKLDDVVTNEHGK